MTTENFTFYTREQILTWTTIRRYETRIGETIAALASGQHAEEAVAAHSGKYVLLGIPEDAGVRANHGMSGAATAWIPFLRAFLNTQTNDYLHGQEILLLGAFDFDEQVRLIEATAPDNDERMTAFNKLVEQMDSQVESLVKLITRHEKIPILIGGGHNNAYGAIKGAAKGLHYTGKIPLAQISAINLDAHTDYRVREGRHSGNAFRYADEDGYLNRYFILGPHENYLTQKMLEDIRENPFMEIITFEDIFIREKMTFMKAVTHATGFSGEGYTGIELDLDAIERALSSASSPSGISVTYARKFLKFVSTECNVAYLHICEGASSLKDGRSDELTGKLISYLVRDFVTM